MSPTAAAEEAKTSVASLFGGSQPQELTIFSPATAAAAAAPPTTDSEGATEGGRAGGGISFGVQEKEHVFMDVLQKG